MKFATKFVKALDNFIDGIVTIVIIIILLLALWGLWDELAPVRDATITDEISHYKPQETIIVETSGGVINQSLSDMIDEYPNVVSWLQVYDTNIDYPVVQGANNEAYIYTAINGEDSRSGSIFLDYRNNTLYEDTYSLLYGHHLIDGLMFSDVIKFGEEEYFNNHEWGKLWLEEHTYDIHIFACCTADGYDETFFNPTIYGDSSTMILHDIIKDNSVHFRDIDVHEGDRIIGFSTCTDIVTNGRVIVYGTLHEIEYEIK